MIRVTHAYFILRKCQIPSETSRSLTVLRHYPSTWCFDIVLDFVFASRMWKSLDAIHRKLFIYFLFSRSTIDGSLCMNARVICKGSESHQVATKQTGKSTERGWTNIGDLKSFWRNTFTRSTQFRDKKSSPGLSIRTDTFACFVLRGRSWSRWLSRSCRQNSEQTLITLLFWKNIRPHWYSEQIYGNSVSRYGIKRDCAICVRKTQMSAAWFDTG
jgi:hypothetical protein